MSSITLDEMTAEKLKGVNAPVQLRDPEGKIVGFFRPLPRTYEKGEMPDTSDEELRRRFTESPRLTSEEVLRRLEERQ